MQNSFLRYLLAFFLGSITTFALFLFMHHMLYNNDNALATQSIYKLVDFVQPISKEIKPIVPKTLPLEPKSVATAPNVPIEQVSTSPMVRNSPTSLPLHIAAPTIDASSIKIPHLPKVAPSSTKGDSVLTPIAQLKPQYPLRAKRMGIEGHVKVELEVDARGEVKDIRIIESVPEGVFDGAVKRALMHWTFRPKSVEGKNVAQKGVLMLNFNLEDR